ncbi:MAG: hypothetical protein AB8B69_21200, partial [Chitinophagales bacterium]
PNLTYSVPSHVFEMFFCPRVLGISLALNLTQKNQKVKPETPYIPQRGAFLLNASKARKS